MQEKVRAAMVEFGLSTDAQARYIDAVSELGELGKAMLKSGEYGSRAIARTAEVADEVGDCLFSMLALCEALGIDAEKALDNALFKYSLRFDRAGSIGSDGGQERSDNY